MTFELTSERLQEIAVSCVTKFMQKQASLTEAIAKEAMDLELNSDQTKRVIEATNTIAYLRQLEKAADRTFEFDVADYNNVMATMCIPEDMLKAAGTPPWLDKDKDSKEDSKEDDKGEKKDAKDKDDGDEKKHKGEDFGKDKKESKDKDEKEEKDEGDEDEDDESSEQEKKAMLSKALSQAKYTLEKMAYDELGLALELDSAINNVARDIHAHEKIAFVAKDETAWKLMKLAGLETRELDNLVFRDKDLANVHHLEAMLKQAEEFVKTKAKTQDFVKRAETVLFKQPVELQKEAVLASMAGGLAKGLGSIIGWGAGTAGATVKNMGRNAGKFGTAAKQRGYSSTDAGVKGYDHLKATKGAAAATAKFGGNKPSLLVHRIGLGGALTATSGLSMTHKNNVRDI